MGYRATRPGERGLVAEPLPLAAIPGQWPGFPGGLPGPVSRAPGPIGPTMPTSIFPTHTRVGDVVTITGPFAGLVQGQVRIRFRGTSWLSPQIIGPATASVVVPEGAQNGLCEVEVNQRRVFGTNCIIDPSTSDLPQKLAWSHKGHPVGAIAEKDTLDLAMFGAIGVLGFGWFTGNNTLRNTGIAATLALMLLRWKMGD